MSATNMTTNKATMYDKVSQSAHKKSAKQNHDEVTSRLTLLAQRDGNGDHPNGVIRASRHQQGRSGVEAESCRWELVRFQDGKQRLKQMFSTMERK